MTHDPEAAERLADEIDNLCGFDAMADPQSVLRKAQELSDMVRAQAAEIERLLRIIADRCPQCRGTGIKGSSGGTGGAETVLWKCDHGLPA